MEHVKHNSDPCWFILEAEDKACALHGEQTATAMTFPDNLIFTCYGSEEALLADLAERDLICGHEGDTP